MHPHMALNTEHWDAVNLSPGKEVPWGRWRKATPRAEEDIRVFYDRFRTVVRTPSASARATSSARSAS